MESNEYDLPRNSLVAKSESLFERCHWLYALCREYLFRDHTPEIRQALFPAGSPESGANLLELGCGPGHYACRFAKDFPELKTTGVDLSRNLLRWARSRAKDLHLNNCSFAEGDAQALSAQSDSVDAVIVSRLFLIVPNKDAVLAEVFRVLKPGGRCFFAEPTSGFTTKLPLVAMWLLSRFMHKPLQQYREPRQAEIMPREKFSALIASQPWSSTDMRYDDWYQYAVCMKGDRSFLPSEDVC
jgi:ubiquinone/menaquinone biosynthesis C-methylase UbiE